MNDTDIKDKISEILSVLFKGEGVESDAFGQYNLIAELGLNSIRFMLLVVELEKYYNFVIEDDFLSMENFQYLDDIVKIVRQHISK